MNKSSWSEFESNAYPSLASNLTFDVVIVGGGIVGLTTAYLLKSAGLRVAVVERDRLGSGETCRTTAHLTQQLDVRLSQLVRDFGEPGAQAAYAGGAAAIDFIESIANADHIDCGFQRVVGYLHGAWLGERDERDQLQHEEQVAKRLGLDAQFVEQVPVSGRPGVRFANQARFHPLQYLQGLASLLANNGVEIFENTEVTEFDEAGLAVRCGDHTLTCGHVVIATHVPLQGRSGFASALALQSKLYPYTSYAVAAEVRRGEVPDALYWDTSDPYYYLRVEPQETMDRLVFGGEDHKTGQASDTAERFARLDALLHKFVPQARVTHHWSGQVIETNDGLPLIGPTAERQFIATGFSGNGMTLGTLAALMAHDAILGRTNRWAKLFAPGRVHLQGGTLDYLEENVDYPYYMAKDRVTPAEGTSPADVAPGEGKILRLNGQTVACSRSCSGEVKTVSAYCTHMGCLVSWNLAEQTWDCACHGSRFTPEGAVIGGPAETPLALTETNTVRT